MRHRGGYFEGFFTFSMQFGWQMNGRDRVGLAESPDFYHTFPNFNIRRFQPPASIVRCRFCFLGNFPSGDFPFGNWIGTVTRNGDLGNPFLEWQFYFQIQFTNWFFGMY